MVDMNTDVCPSAMTIIMNTFILLTIGTVFNIFDGFTAQAQGENDESQLRFRSLFVRVPDQRISLASVKNISGSDIESCARSCVKETDFECKSFDFANTRRQCRLHAYSHLRQRLQPQIGVDHYKTAYEKLYRRIPNHIVTLRHEKVIRSITVEECARHCYLERRFTCRGFDYVVIKKDCWLTDLVPQTSGGVLSVLKVDFYERVPEGALRHFVNYGFGALSSKIANVYDSEIHDVDLTTCAQRCLEEKSFKCMSLDYNFTHRRCYLSYMISANTHGLEYDQYTLANISIMHYERIEKHLNFFYATPYSLIISHNDKEFERVTTELCARHCLMEQTFICRSFDYEVIGGKCRLSSKTGSDVGGLFVFTTQIHHFEMKPILDCGGNLTTDMGDVASPNWPRQYAPYEHCVWNIRVSPYKVIHFIFVHIDFGPITGSACSPENDHLILQQSTATISKETCISPASPHKRLLTETNSVTLVFTSNALRDAPGFHAFYAAEWPCIATLTEDGGEFASPDWPRAYPAGSRCNWLIQAPDGFKVRLTFTHMQLGMDNYQNCSRFHDQLTLYDGADDQKPAIDTYCGSRSSGLSQESSSSYLRVTLATYPDSDGRRTGFHAKYTFVELPLPPTTEAKTSTLTSDLTTSTHDNITATMTLKIEPTEEASKEIAVSENNAVLVNPTSGSVRPREPPKNGSVNRTLLAVLITLIAIVVCAAVAMFLCCKYRRKKVPKSGAGKTQHLHAESSALCDEHNIIAMDASRRRFSKTTSFANPLYATPKKSSKIYRKKPSTKITVLPQEKL